MEWKLNVETSCSIVRLSPTPWDPDKLEALQGGSWLATSRMLPTFFLSEPRARRSASPNTCMTVLRGGCWSESMLRRTLDSVKSKPVCGAIRCKAPRRGRHLRQPCQLRICKLQTLQGLTGFESHPLRQSRFARLAARLVFRLRSTRVPLVALGANPTLSATSRSCVSNHLASVAGSSGATLAIFASIFVSTIR